MSPAAKAGLVAGLCEGVREAALAGIRQRHPLAGPRDGTPIDEEVLRRRLPFHPDSIERPVHVYTPEDVLPHKLRGYRNGGERSDRQWRDIIGIVRVQAGGLDRRYLTEAAGTLGVSDLLARALEE